VRRCSVAAGATCDVYPQERVKCGYSGIWKSVCESKGCCWDTNVRDAPWCFKAGTAAEPSTTTTTTTAYPGQPNCDVGHPTKRIDCGYPAIHPSACRQRKCCWDESVRDVPRCFYGAEVHPQPNCDVGHPSKRVDCGYPGISEYTCRQRRCCWDESVRGVPWCFHGATDTTTTTTTTTTTSPPIAHCDVPPKSRQQCGYAYIGWKQCVSRGCCWQPSTSHGVPSCYHAAAAKTPSPPRGCDPKLAHRETCGYIGMSAEQCSEKACCWDDSSGYARTKCYLPNSGQSLALPFD